jgi:hypothetical protein
MGYYLLDHPNPNYPQTRPRIAWGWTAPTGLVTVHVSAGALDRIAPDTGAENVAGYISRRTDAGGYPSLHDSDSSIDMAPDHLMTWHTAAYNLNGPGWAICAACLPNEWDPDAPWTINTMTRMGRAVCEFFYRQGIDPEFGARWLDPDDVRATGGRIVGLIHHGTIQPWDRSDAWINHPRRAELDQMLVAAILAAHRDEAITPPPPKEWFDMDENELRGIIREEFRNHQEGDVAVQLDGHLYRLIPQDDGGLMVRWITGPAELAGLQQTGQVRRGDVANITPETEAWFRQLPRVEIPGTPL